MIYNLNTIMMMTKPSVTKTKQNTLRRDSKIKLSVDRVGGGNASPPLLSCGVWSYYYFADRGMMREEEILFIRQINWPMAIA